MVGILFVFYDNYTFESLTKINKENINYGNNKLYDRRRL